MNYNRTRPDEDRDRFADEKEDEKDKAVNGPGLGHKRPLVPKSRRRINVTAAMKSQEGDRERFLNGFVAVTLDHPDRPRIDHRERLRYWLE